MNNWIVLALVAGLIAAVLFSAATAVTSAFTLLFFVAPLPLLVAGLGYGLAVAVAGGIAGTLALAVALNVIAAVLFFATAALPAALIVRLALLSRQAGTDSSETALEWYPEGRIVLAIALLATVLVAILLVSMGPDAESFRAYAGAIIDQMVRPQGGAALPAAQGEQVKALFLALFPFAAAAGWTAITFANFRFAQEIVRQLKIGSRPSFRFGALEFPRSALGLLAAALVAAFLPGMAGLVGQASLGAMMIAFAILGLAVLHALLEGHSMRLILLTALYFAVLVLGLVPVLPLVVLAVLDMILGLRARARPAGGA